MQGTNGVPVQNQEKVEKIASSQYQIQLHQQWR